MSDTTRDERLSAPPPDAGSAPVAASESTTSETATGARARRPHRDGIGHTLRTTYRMMHRLLQDRIEPYGVTIGMWYFLRALWRKDGIMLTELCRHVGTMAPTAVSAVNAMEAAGLIYRQRDENDRRCTLIYLTEKGRDLEDFFRPIVEGVSEAALAGLGSQQRQDLLDSLKTIQRNLSPLVPNAFDPLG